MSKVVDLKQIDTFFSKERAFDSKRTTPLNKRNRILRFVKLVMPSIAALLIAMILVFPTLKKENALSQYDLTAPKKGELEKLHVENTFFSTTDADGKISSFTADLMDETKPGSQIIQITNPKGKIPINTNDEFVDLQSKTGFYHQNDNVIVLQTDVEAVYNKQTTVQTDKAEYDFKKAYGKGNAPVYAFGSWGKLWSEGFAYDKNKDILYLNGKTKIVRENNELNATKQVIYYQNDNKIVAIGNVKLEQEVQTLYADKAVVYLTDSKKPELAKIEAFGNVEVYAEDAIAQGDKGLYLPHENRLELEDNVSIKKDGHIIYGDRAISDTKTKISRMISNRQNKRVSGMINGQNIKRGKNEKN